MENNTHQHQNNARSQRRKRRGGSFWKTFWKVLGTMCLVGVLSIGFFACIFMSYVKTTLAPELTLDLDSFTMNLSSVILYEDENGQWQELEKLYGIENRTWVDFEDIPDYAWQAAVAIEDERYFEHEGVDWLRTCKAVMNMFFGMKDTFGGSTITQQVIKNLTEDNEPYVKRKVTEIFRALELDKNYEKEEILEVYLNKIFFGENAYGIGAAAETYFGVEAKDLTLAQCASIIAITNNPSMYDPLFNNTIGHKTGDVDENGEPIYEPWTTAQWNKYRQELILDKMLEQGYITQEEHDQAVNEPLIFVGTPEYEAIHGTDDDGVDDTPAENDTWSYFVDMVFEDVKKGLMNEYGYSEDTAVSLLYNAGYKIYATVDPRIQNIAESVYGDVNNLNYTSGGKQLQSGITIIDPYTGEIVGTAGRIGEKPGKRTLSYATAKRPCGSAIKPLSVYAPAIENGVITPASVYDDYPVGLNSRGSGGYPKNDPARYRGLVTLSTAVKYSVNTVAVRVLNDMGFATSYDFMVNNLNFDLSERDLAEAPLAMGGFTYGVSTVEMAAGYSAFINEGVYTVPHSYVKVEDQNGNVILDNPGESWKAMSDITAYQINVLLQDVMKSGTGTLARIPGMTTAGKTGTTSDNFDRYFVGYTPYYCAAVWVGYGDNTTVRVNGGNPAAILWNKVMSQVHEGLEDKSFSTPSSGLSKVTVCSQSGLRPGENCTSTHTVYVTAGNEPKETCTFHTTVEICTESGKLANEFCPPECRETRVVSTVDRQVIVIPTGSTTDPVTGEVISTGTPIACEDSGQVLNSLNAAGPCTVHNAENGIDPNNPDGETDPNNPDGGDPTDPDGGDPTIPVDPTDPTDPDHGGEPTEPTDPDGNKPTEPTEPTDPDDDNSLSGWLAGLTGN